MKMHQVIHDLTLLSMLVVARKSIVGSLRVFSAGTIEMKLTPIAGAALWVFLFWKIWKRPRAWSLGVGMLLFFMVTFQTYLRQRALARPDFDIHAPGHSTAHFVGAELPLLAAAIGCLWLRLFYPDKTDNPCQSQQP
jgi:hypothetical protein